MLAKVKQLFQRKIVKDLSKTTIAKIIAVALGLLLKIAIVRLLTKEDFGLIAVLTSLNLYFGMIADFSTHAITQRNIIKDKANYRYHYHIYVNAKILTSIASVFLFILTAFFLGYFEWPLIMSILIVNMMLGSIAALPKVLLESFEKFGIYSKIMVMVAVANLLIQVAVVYVFQTVESLVFALMFISMVNMYLYFNYIGKDFDVVYSFSLIKISDVTNLLKDSFPLFAGTFFYLLYYRIDTIMIEKIVDLEAAAEYSLGFSMADQVIEMLWVQFIIVFYPKMVKMYDESKILLSKRLKQISFILFFIYGGIFLMSFFFAEAAFGFVFGSQYHYSGYIFSITIIGSFLISLFSLYYRILVICNKQKIYLYVSMFAAVFNVPLNIYLIGEFGNIGAAYGTIVINLIILLVVLVYANENLRGLNEKKSVG